MGLIDTIKCEIFGHDYPPLWRHWNEYLHFRSCRRCSKKAYKYKQKSNTNNTTPYVVKAKGVGVYREEFDTLQEAAERYHQLRNDENVTSTEIGNWEP